MDILNEKTDLMIKRLNKLADEGVYFELKKEICNTAIDILIKVKWNRFRNKFIQIIKTKLIC